MLLLTGKAPYRRRPVNSALGVIRLHHDLTLIADLCTELGLHSHHLDASLQVTLQPSVVLTFKNYLDNGSAGCLMAFEGTPWHVHGVLIDLINFRVRGKGQWSRCRQWSL